MNEAMKSRRETLDDDAPSRSSGSTMRASRARSACRRVFPSTVWNVLTVSPVTGSVCERTASHRSLFLRLLKPRLV